MLLFWLFSSFSVIWFWFFFYFRLGKVVLVFNVQNLVQTGHAVPFRLFHVLRTDVSEQRHGTLKLLLTVGTLQNWGCKSTRRVCFSVKSVQLIHLRLLWAEKRWCVCKSRLVKNPKWQCGHCISSLPCVRMCCCSLVTVTAINLILYNNAKFETFALTYKRTFIAFRINNVFRGFQAVFDIQMINHSTFFWTLFAAIFAKGRIEFHLMLTGHMFAE